MFVVSARSLDTSRPESFAGAAVFLARASREVEAALGDAAFFDFAVEVRAIVSGNLDRAELFKKPVGLIGDLIHGEIFKELLEKAGGTV